MDLGFSNLKKKLQNLVFYSLARWKGPQYLFLLKKKGTCWFTLPTKCLFRGQQHCLYRMENYHWSIMVILFSMFLNLILIYFKITTLSSFILEHTFRDQTVLGQASIRGHDEYWTPEQPRSIPLEMCNSRSSPSLVFHGTVWKKRLHTDY